MPAIAHRVGLLIGFRPLYVLAWDGLHTGAVPILSLLRLAGLILNVERFGSFKASVKRRLPFALPTWKTSTNGAGVQ